MNTKLNAQQAETLERLKRNGYRINYHTGGFRIECEGKSVMVHTLSALQKRGLVGPEVFIYVEGRQYAVGATVGPVEAT